MDYIIGIVMCYVVFKLGEYHSYYRISKKLVSLKDLHDIQKRMQVEDNKTVSQVLVEKINGQYYGYLDNNFIGQGAKLEDVERQIKEFIGKNPDRYNEFTVELKENK